MAGAGVEIDTSELDRFIRNLADGLDNHGADLARAHAEQTASTIRNNVPRRSGRLAGSVQVVDVPGGSGVEYGAAVPYASYIEHRTNTVADAVDGAGEPFYRAAVQLAESEARHA